MRTSGSKAQTTIDEAPRLSALFVFHLPWALWLAGKGKPPHSSAVEQPAYICVTEAMEDFRIKTKAEAFLLELCSLLLPFLTHITQYAFLNAYINIICSVYLVILLLALVKLAYI